MKFIGNLIFWMIVIVVCIPILFFAPVGFAIFIVLFLLYCVGMAIMALMVDKKNK